MQSLPWHCRWNPHRSQCWWQSGKTTQYVETDSPPISPPRCNSSTCDTDRRAVAFPVNCSGDSLTPADECRTCTSRCRQHPALASHSSFLASWRMKCKKCLVSPTCHLTRCRKRSAWMNHPTNSSHGRSRVPGDKACLLCVTFRQCRVLWAAVQWHSRTLSEQKWRLLLACCCPRWSSTTQCSYTHPAASCTPSSWSWPSGSFQM